MQVVNYPQCAPFVRYEPQFSQLSFRSNAPPTAFFNPTYVLKFIQSYWRRLAWSAAAAAAAPPSGTYKSHPMFARYAMYTNTRT